MTCNRYAPSPADQETPGQRLAAALKHASANTSSPVTVRTVVCLNGCPHPCTAALRGPGKCVIRFAELTTDDAPALIQVAEMYAQSADGDIPVEALPASLRGKVSDRVSIGAV
jgi:predicted metal-binding protein